ncbi:MAG: hypothetical protein E6K66_00115 [Nitrospirae bacterium]|nr:MAG: hypothetical protein E6K66_00115 [Nitrospirota bacterium]
MEERRASEFMNPCDKGHVLLAALFLIFMLGIAGMTSLYLADQDGPGVSAMREDNVAQQFADGAAEIVMRWFHDPSTTPIMIAGLLDKRQGDLESGPSFFDVAGRSQFVGTADRPDILLDAANEVDNQTLNDWSNSFPNALGGLGRILKLKVYGPLQPGLLSTVEVTATTVDRRPVRRTVQLQLGAVSIPAVRAAVQVGQTLGALQPGGESPVLVHWGDQRVLGDLAVQRVEDLVLKSTAAPVTGQSYDQMVYTQDRWTEYWIGGTVSVISPPPGQGANPPLPENVHVHQYPMPGVRLDRWDYDSLKKIALRWGTYYRLDRVGQLHPQVASDSDQGITPTDALESQVIGDHHGLVFIDTVDGQLPRVDNMGTLVLDTDYFEGLLVVQGHVVLRPRATGKSVPALSPSPEGTNSLGARVPVQLSGIHVNGVLCAAGTIMLERSTHIFGALIAGNTVTAAGAGTVAEVWYNVDLAQGLFRGLPVVYRAPGTWLAKY